MAAVDEPVDGRKEADKADDDDDVVHRGARNGQSGWEHEDDARDDGEEQGDDVDEG